MGSKGSGRTWERRRRVVRAATAPLLLLAGLAAGLAAGAAALAQEAPDDVARRMDDRLYFVEALNHGWEPLLADLDATVAQEDSPPLRRVRDAAQERYAELRLRDGTEAGERRAFDLFVLLAGQADDATRRPEFARRAAQVELRWAQRAEAADDDATALRLALSAAERSPGFEEAYDLVARLGLKESSRLEAKDDFVAALAALESWSGRLPEGGAARRSLAERTAKILAETGEVRIAWLGSPERLAQVRGPKTDFTAGRLEFRPLGGDRAPPAQDVAKPIRVRNGRYEVTARGSGGAGTWAVPSVEVAAAGTDVVVLAALPENMVVVPSVAGQPAFLIDRTEVTSNEFRSPGGGNAGGGLPASNVRFGQAQQYARSAGKDLPSHAQWMTAAFGDPGGAGRRYPWGDAPPQPGVNFVGGQEGPQPVGSCPAGRSAFGCLDMAGNVWEWLADERFIGGGFRRVELTAVQNPEDDTSTGWTADVTRDAALSDELWARMPDGHPDRKRFINYRPKGNESTLEQIGLRCVVPLGQPRRNP